MEDAGSGGEVSTDADVVEEASAAIIAVAGPSKISDEPVTTIPTSKARALPPKSILKSTASNYATKVISSSSTITDTNNNVQSLHTIAGLSSARNKRPRSPLGNTFTKSVEGGKSSDQEITQRRRQFRVIWKEDAELVAIRLIYKSVEEDELNRAGMSHQGEGKTLRKSRPLLDWNSPRRVVIPLQYLERRIRSSNMNRPGDNVEGEGDSVLDSTGLGSPEERREQLPPDQSGLLNETAIIPFPEDLSLVAEENASQQMEQSWGQTASTDALGISHTPRDGWNGSSAASDETRMDREREGQSRWSRNGNESGREERYSREGRRDSRDGESRYGSGEYRRPDEGYSNKRQKGERDNTWDSPSVYQREPFTRRESTDETHQNREHGRASWDEPSPREENFDRFSRLPPPKGVPSSQRSSSNPTNTTSSRYGQSDSGYRRASASDGKRDYSYNRDKATICNFYRTPGGCNQGSRCAFQHM